MFFRLWMQPVSISSVEIVHYCSCIWSRAPHGTGIGQWCWTFWPLQHSLWQEVTPFCLWFKFLKTPSFSVERGLFCYKNLALEVVKVVLSALLPLGICLKCGFSFSIRCWYFVVLLICWWFAGGQSVEPTAQISGTRGWVKQGEHWRGHEWAAAWWAWCIDGPLGVSLPVSSCWCQSHPQVTTISFESQLCFCAL